jgi:hypothetical protein
MRVVVMAEELRVQWAIKPELGFCPVSKIESGERG